MTVSAIAAKSSANSRDRSDLDRAALHHVFGFMTSLADTRLRKAFFKHMEGLNLRPVEFTIIILLQTNELVTQKKLCQALDSPAPNLVVILDRLQERSLISRTRSEEDRREQHIVLTESGQELATQARAISKTMEQEVVSVLSAGEQLMLFELLNKIAQGKEAG